MTMHDDLLDIAIQLARLDPGRPRQASLRRAVSTAYYAVFHALADCCADELVGRQKPWEFFSPIYRSLDHARAKAVLSGWVRKPGNDISLIGQTFVELQEKRHIADYDPEPRLGRVETLDLIDQARTAVARIKSLSSEDKLRLATQLITRKRTSS
jgi:hypothetical protein